MFVVAAASQLAALRLKASLTSADPAARAEAARLLALGGHRDLSGSDLSGVDLTGAELTGVSFRGANLSRAKNAELVIARTRIIGEGDLIGWKKCANDVIVKLLIPRDAPRSHAFGRKCRAGFADVLEVFGANKGVSLHDGTTEYVAGARVTAHEWCDDWQQECAGGIHFYITREEAEAHV